MSNPLKIGLRQSATEITNADKNISVKQIFDLSAAEIGVLKDDISTLEEEIRAEYEDDDTVDVEQIIKDKKTQITLDRIGSIIGGRFFVDKAQVDNLQSSQGYSAYYQDETTKEFYTVVSEVTYDDDENPTGDWESFIQDMEGYIQSKFTYIEEDIETEVTDVYKTQLQEAKREIEALVLPDDIGEQVSEVQKKKEEVERKGYQLDDIALLRQSTIRLQEDIATEIRSINDAIAKLDPKADADDIKLKKKLQRVLQGEDDKAEQILISLNHEEAKKGGERSADMSSRLETAGYEIDELEKFSTYLTLDLKPHLQELKAMTTNSQEKRDLDVQISLVDEYTKLISKKKALTENENKIKSNNKIMNEGLINKRNGLKKTPEWKQMEADNKRMEKENVEHRANIATLEGRIVSAAELNTSGSAAATTTTNPAATTSAVTGTDKVDVVDPKNVVNNNPNHSVVTAEGDPGPKYDEFVEKVENTESEKQLHDAYKGVLTTTELNRLAQSFVASGGTGPNFEKQLKGLSKPQRKYVEQYMKICQNDNLNAAQQIRKLAKKEQAMLKELWGNKRQLKRASKQLKKNYKYHAEFGESLEQLLCYSMMSEMQEQANQRGLEYAAWLRKYDKGQNKGIDFCGECPSIHNVDQYMDKIMGNFESNLSSLGGGGLSLDKGQKKLLWDYCKGELTGNNYASYAGKVGIVGYPIYISPTDRQKKYSPTLGGGDVAIEGKHNAVDVGFESMNNQTLMRWIATFVHSKQKTGQEKMVNGHEEAMQEAAKRHLEGRDGFSFIGEMKELIEKNTSGFSLSETEITSLLHDCVESLITPGVADHIHEKYSHNRNSKNTQTKNQLISLYFVNSLCAIHGLPCDAQEVAKNKLMEIYKGGWNVHGQPTLGNEAVGSMVNNVISNKLKRGRKRLDEPVGVMAHIMKPDGTFRGLTGSVDMLSATIVTMLGADPKHAPKIAAYTKVGLTVLAVSYGRQFTQYLFSGGLGDKVRKIGVTALLAGTLPRLIMNRDFEEAFKYFKDGDDKSEGFVKGGSSKLLEMAGFSDPEAEAARTDIMDAKTYTSAIFGNMKMSEIGKYITKKKEFGSTYRYYMTEEQKKAFLLDKTIGEQEKIVLKALVTGSGGHVESASRVFDSGLAQSGVDYEKFDEITGGVLYGELTLREFQMHWAEAEKFFEGLGDLLGDDPSKKRELLHLYMTEGRNNPDMQASLEAKIAYMKDFDKHYKEMYPYVRYHFLPFRTDMYAKVGLDKTKHRDLLMDKMDDEAGYNQMMLEYLKKDPTDPHVDDNFNKAFYSHMGGPVTQPFLENHIVSPNSLDNLKKITTTSGSSFENLNNVLSSAQDKRVLRDADKMPDGVAESRLNNLPGFSSNPDKSTFISLNKDGEFGVWLKSDKGVREEFKMATFAGTKLNIDLIGFLDKGSTNRDFLIKTDGASDPLRLKYNVFEKMLTGLDSGETDITVEYDDLSKDDPNFAQNIAVRLKSFTKNNSNWISNLFDGAGKVVNDIDQRLEEAFEITKPKIRFERTGNTRP